MAWAYPQKEHGLYVLMVFQQWQCNICHYDWLPLAKKIHEEFYKGYTVPDMNQQIDWMLVKRLKRKVERMRAPEVDHIVPIFKGGFSIGLGNHQSICYICHRKKTSKDLTKVKVDKAKAA
jgi:hypothetical protein